MNTAPSSPEGVDINIEREEFEEWAKPTWFVERHALYPDTYKDGGTECAWKGWQARAALPAPAMPATTELLAPKPLTNPHNWFPALSAIVEVWKDPRAYKPGATEQMIANAAISIKMWNETFAAPIAEVPSPTSDVKFDHNTVTALPRTPDDEALIAKMNLAYRSCPGPLRSDGMRAVLAVVRAHDSQRKK